VALARLLITSPRLLLLDEPFSNLDTAHKNIMLSVIEDLGEKLDVTCLAVLHDPADILSWADIIIVMKEGNIVQQGTPKEIYHHPLNEYVAALFGPYTILIDPSITQKRLIRPENIIISNHATDGMSGIVRKILFRGNNYLVEIKSGEQLITAQVSEVNFSEGDRVYISWLKEAVVNIN
jgi:ABC-type Fe3+/spermidine/putrescine transport system ATPase subunit